MERGDAGTRRGVASSKHEAELVRAIQHARRQADFVVLIMHWGGQGNHLITPRQRQLARQAVRAGCDAVIGMHPHVLQGAEYFGRVPVFYSIGNFAFPSSSPDALMSIPATASTYIDHGAPRLQLRVVRDTRIRGTA